MTGTHPRHVCVLGTQWGDEGKGKIVDVLSEGADVIARYQGGANAGHTVRVEGEEFVLHLIPSGILYPGVRCLMGNGTVVDPWTLLEEMAGDRRLAWSYPYGVIEGRLSRDELEAQALRCLDLAEACAEQLDACEGNRT